MERQLFYDIIDRYLAGTASAGEQELLREYYDRMAAISADPIAEDDMKVLEDRMLDEILGRIRREDNIVKMDGKSGWRRFYWISVAAVILVMLTATLYLWNPFIAKDGSIPKAVVSRFGGDVSPGGDRAILTLADGSTVTLDSAHIGAVAKQGTMQIMKRQDGQLVYENSTGKPTNTTTLFNSVRTPRGGKYAVVLPDGSLALLNAASSLRYPTAFTGNERRVELTGEAYFEVAKDKAMPFHVSVGNTDVEVLGTHFNVMAYANEDALKTTLLEGSVKIKDARTDKPVIIQPGQQVRVDQAGQISLARDVNIEQEVAWKNGYFSFEEIDIKSVMRQVERWYDVEVVYAAPFKQNFNATVPRNVPVSKLLMVLEMTGKVHFKIEGKKIIVQP